MADVGDAATRLKEIRLGAGLSVRKLARALGMSSSGYKHYEDRFKKSYLPREFAEMVAAKGAAVGIDRMAVLALAGDATVGADLDDAHMSLVPVYDVAASAGPGLIPPDHEAVAYRLELPTSYLASLTESAPRHLQVISVKGTSMEPTLKPGDLILLDTAKTSLAFDGLFVLDVDGAVLVKRIGRSERPGWVRIKSDNRADDPFERPSADVRVVGKVILRMVRE